LSGKTSLDSALAHDARHWISIPVIQAKLLEIAELLKAEVLDGIADELPRLQKGLTPSAVMNLAKELLEKEWQSPAKRLAKISGKAALTALNQWTQSEYRVSFTNAAVAIETRSEEIDSEITGFLSAVEYNEAF